MNTEWLQLLKETLQKPYNEETVIQAINAMMEEDKEQESMTLLRLSTTKTDIENQSTPIGEFLKSM